MCWGPSYSPCNGLFRRTFRGLLKTLCAWPLLSEIFKRYRWDPVAGRVAVLLCPCWVSVVAFYQRYSRHVSSGTFGVIFCSSHFISFCSPWFSEPLSGPCTLRMALSSWCAGHFVIIWCPFLSSDYLSSEVCFIWHQYSYPYFLFRLMFPWYILCHTFTLNLLPPLYSKEASCRLHAVRSCAWTSLPVSVF